MVNSGKKILLIDMHPDAESFCAAMSSKYFEGALQAGFDIEKISLRELSFNPILLYGYRKEQQLESDLVDIQEKIRKCNHLVLITPVWWGSVPALAKGFFDRVFVKGFSHMFDVQRKMPVALLKGRSASVIYTQGSPWFYTKFILGDVFWKAIKNSILSFAGFSPVKRRYFDKVKSGTDSERIKILETAYELGKEGF